MRPLVGRERAVESGSWAVRLARAVHAPSWLPPLAGLLVVQPQCTANGNTNQGLTGINLAVQWQYERAREAAALGTPTDPSKPRTSQTDPRRGQERWAHGVWMGSAPARTSLARRTRKTEWFSLRRTDTIAARKEGTPGFRPTPPAGKRKWSRRDLHPVYASLPRLQQH